METRSGLDRVVAFSARRTMERILSDPDPCRAIGACVERGSYPGASSFERYAAQVFRSAGTAQLIELGKRYAIKLLVPENGRLARLVCASRLDGEQRRCLISAENALNRLICIMDALADGMHAPEEAHGSTSDLPVGFTFLGTAFHSRRASFRSAQILLPRLERGTENQLGDEKGWSSDEKNQQGDAKGWQNRATNHPGDVDLAYFNEVDWLVMDGIASNARSVLQRSILANSVQNMLGVCCASQSDWDVRSRLAHIVERLELPLHCAFQFDCDMSRRAVSIAVTCPDAGQLPPSGAGELQMVGARELDGAYTSGNAREPDSARELSNAREPDGAHAPAVVCEWDAYMAFVLRLVCLVGAAGFGSGRDVRHAYVIAYDAQGNTLATCAFEREAYTHAVLAAQDAGILGSRTLRFDPQGVAVSMGDCGLFWARTPDEAAALRALDDGMAAQRIAPYYDERSLSAEASSFFKARTVHDMGVGLHDERFADTLDHARQDATLYPLAAVAQLEIAVAEMEQALQREAAATDSRLLYAPHAYARLAACLGNDVLDVGSEAERFMRGGELPETADSAAYTLHPVSEEYFEALMLLSQLHENLGDLARAEHFAHRCMALAPTVSAAYYRMSDVLHAQGRDGEARSMHIAGKHQEMPAKLPENIVALAFRAMVALADAGAPLAAAPYAALVAQLFADDDAIVSACRSYAAGIKNLRGNQKPAR